MNQNDGHGDPKAKKTNDATSSSDQTNHDIASGLKKGGITFCIREILEVIFS